VVPLGDLFESMVKRTIGVKTSAVFCRGTADCWTVSTDCCSHCPRCTTSATSSNWLTMPTVRRSVALLGATGSIGTQTLDVLRREPELFELVALSGGEQLGELASIVNEFHVTRRRCHQRRPSRHVGPTRGANVDIVVGDEGLSALAGARTSSSTRSSIRRASGHALGPEGREATGPRQQGVAHRGGGAGGEGPLDARATMLPVDSEHCAIHQWPRELTGEAGYPDVRRLLLTASGGPFRGWSSTNFAARPRPTP